jgi:hypothetical protein
METVKKDFDCLEMKNQIQAKIYTAIKDMYAAESCERETISN